WTALESHYQTQPLPTWTSWYIHQMPNGFHGLSVGFMFYAELVAPFFIFGPRPVRIVAFISLVFLQLLIAATGNYGFFNLLTVVICFSILDDRDWNWLLRLWPVKSKPAPVEDVADPIPQESGKIWSRFRRLAVGVAAALIIAITTAQTVDTV